MKKLMCMLAIVLLLSAFLLSCEIDENDEKSPDSSDAVTDKVTMPWEDPALSEEDAAIREVSDTAFTSEYGFDDLSLFTVMIDGYRSNAITVRYYLTIAGVLTNEFYTVTLTSELAVDTLDDWNKGDYSKYISEDFIQKANEARAKLDEQTKEYPEEDGAYYLEEHSDGYLYLNVEIIVHIDTQSDSEYVEMGCGIDHDHLFFSEKVCPVK